MGNQHVVKRASVSFQDEEIDDYSALNVEDLRKEYVIGDVLGRGEFGVVRQATLRKDSRVRAVKSIPSHGHCDDEWSEASMAIKEARLLQHLRHPSIVRSWGLYEDCDYLHIVMDFCSGGELYHKLREVKRFSEEDAASMAIQMLSAVQYIHENSVMHRDIKAENFLLEDDLPSLSYVVKLIDFGFACHFSKNQVFTEVCGSLSYMAPEILRKKYTHMVDMWSFGVLIYLLLFGQYPFRSKTKTELVLEIASKEPKWAKRNVSEIAVDFVKLFLNTDQQQRAESQEGLLHPFIWMGTEPASPVGQRRLSEGSQVSLPSEVKASSGEALAVSPQQATTKGRKRGICLRQQMMTSQSSTFSSPPRVQQAAERHEPVAPRNAFLPNLAHRQNMPGSIVPPPPLEALPVLPGKVGTAD